MEIAPLDLECSAPSLRTRCGRLRLRENEPLQVELRVDSECPASSLRLRTRRASDIGRGLLARVRYVRVSVGSIVPPPTLTGSGSLRTGIFPASGISMPYPARWQLSRPVSARTGAERGQRGNLNVR